MLIRTVLVFALLGVGAYEGGQILFARIQASDVAGDAAKAAAERYVTPDDYESALAAAEDMVRDSSSNAVMRPFEVTKDGTITVDVEVQAKTLFVRRVSFLRDLGVQHAHVDAVHER